MNNVRELRFYRNALLSTGGLFLAAAGLNVYDAVQDYPEVVEQATVESGERVTNADTQAESISHAGLEGGIAATEFVLAGLCQASIKRQSKHFVSTLYGRG